MISCRKTYPEQQCNIVLLLFLVLRLVPFAVHGCPNDCSGHGECTIPDHVCNCDLGWYSADCAYRWCPFGQAHIATPQWDINGDGDRLDATDLDNLESTRLRINWFPDAVGTWESYPADGGQASELLRVSTFMPEAARDYELHFNMECSNAGYCDRQTGECQCLPGHYGYTCEYMFCPNECSGHGVCLPHGLHGGASHGDQYGTIFRRARFSCRCDAGYVGGDCSQRRCPVGDDPLTSGQQDEIQQIHLDDDESAIAGSFYLTFRSSNDVELQSRQISALHQEEILSPRDGSTIIQLSVTGSHGTPDSTVTATESVLCCLSVGDNIKFGVEYRHVLAIAEDGLTITVADGFSTTSSSGFKFYDRAAEIESALEALPEDILLDVTVSLDEVTTNGVKYDITFVDNPGDLPLLKIITERPRSLQDGYAGDLPEHTFFKWRHHLTGATSSLTNGKRAATTATVSEKTKTIVSGLASVSSSATSTITMSADSSAVMRKDDAIILGSSEETFSGGLPFDSRTSKAAAHDTGRHRISQCHR